jgi:hypothetical protein
MRPAVLRFGLLLALIAGASCWRSNSTVIANRVEVKGPDPTGSYWCSIDEDQYKYPPFPCAIRRVGNDFVLAKLGGSVRFRGRVVPDGQAGFGFVGQLFCPWGDCTAPLHGAFTPTRRGELEGRFRDNAMVVKLVPAPASAFGGSSYGGDGYGGFYGPYGGGAYGGTVYGVLQP